MLWSTVFSHIWNNGIYRASILGFPRSQRFNVFPFDFPRIHQKLILKLLSPEQSNATVHIVNSALMCRIGKSVLWINTGWNKVPSISNNLRLSNDRLVTVASKDQNIYQMQPLITRWGQWLKCNKALFPNIQFMAQNVPTPQVVKKSVKGTRPRTEGLNVPFPSSYSALQLLGEVLLFSVRMHLLFASQSNLRAASPTCYFIHIQVSGCRYLFTWLPVLVYLIR